MKFKNIINLKDGTKRIGFEVEEKDYTTRNMQIFGQEYPLLEFNNIRVGIAIQRHLKHEGLGDKVVHVRKIKHDMFKGFVYYTTQTHEEFQKYIEEKYNLSK